MKLYLCLFLLFLSTAPARPQDQPLREFGKLTELKDKRKVYVTADYTGPRDRILAELAKYPGLEVVDSPDEAEFYLAYSVVTQTEKITVSKLVAFTKGTNDRQRVLWTEDESNEGLSKPNSVNLARHFIKSLKKVRGEK